MSVPHAVSSIVPIAHLASYGLAGAFVLALLERLIPVVPSYGLFIFLGSALVGQPLDLVPLILVTTIASTLSAICWYGIGHALGEERTHALVKRYGRYVGLKESVYLSLAGRYTRNAFIATFMGQTIPVVRCYLSLPAGILALPLATFALAVLIGSSLWVGLFTAMGYGLHVLGWDPLVATLIAVVALITIEGGLAWFLSKRNHTV
ncbi:MAG: DedA family protein [Sphingobium sp.]|nr:DedA family protein [Sphingobium sp.]